VQASLSASQRLVPNGASKLQEDGYNCTCRHKNTWCAVVQRNKDVDKPMI
jgi:hypothetical protein